MTSTLITREEREQAIADIIQAGLENPLVDKELLNELFMFYSGLVLFYERVGNMELTQQILSESQNDNAGFNSFLNTVVNPTDGTKLFQAILATVI